MKVQLRPIKSTVSLIDYIRQLQRLRSLYQRICRKLPVRFAADAVLRPRGKLYEIGKTEFLIYFLNQQRHLPDFRNDLFFRHKNMRVVLCKCTDPHQPVQLPGFLIAMHQSQFSQPKRQFPIGTRLALIYQHTARAAHRLDCIIRTIHDQCIHYFPIMIPMAGCFP